MKLLFSNLDKISIILTITITACIFYSSNLGERISEIETEYIIETNTLNNSFITLGVKADLQDNQGFQEVKNNLNEQMKRFNEGYDTKESERQLKKNKKLWVDRIIYILLLFQFILMIRLSAQKTDIG
ncbi:MAG: hypothetical protein UV36_C0035G0009 [Parcubacteria group bacterium GW2011_GWC2_42_6]|nr:MAG: hypothetical protein UV36_C0035G0009 [Parcubacteria group bacterium GW2011_GWC2_42_6]